MEQGWPDGVPGERSAVSNWKSRLDTLAAQLDIPKAASLPLPAKRRSRQMVASPIAVPVSETFDAATNLRSQVLCELKKSRDVLWGIKRELAQEEVGTDDHRELSAALRDAEGVRDSLQHRLDNSFVPQHSPRQLLSPQDVLRSDLFRVLARGADRTANTEKNLASTQYGVLRYRGPELSQTDGLVFMVLLNMLRDISVGLQAEFLPADVCELMLGGYSGQSREQLRQIILRLQQGVVEFPRFAVQLAQRFEYPDDGPWRVALDNDIVELFKWSRATWLELGTTLSLSTGLATWLYGYVKSLAILRDVQLDVLRALCGSRATAGSFEKQVRRALHELVEADVIAPGWEVSKGVVHWCAPAPGAVRTLQEHIV